MLSQAVRADFGSRALKAATFGLRAASKLSSLIVRGRASDVPVEAARRFLFLQFEPALGWALHGAPVFEAVKLARPDAHVSVACSSPNYEVLLNNPYVDTLVKVTDPRQGWAGFWHAWLEAASLVREHRVDRVVTTAWNKTGRLTALAALSGAGLPLGFSRIPGLYERTAVYDPTKSVAENNLEVVRLLGGAAVANGPQIYCSDDDMREADRLLDRFGLQDGSPVVALVTQTSGLNPSQWYDDRFAEVADELSRRGMRVVFVGSEGQAGPIDQIRAMMTAPSVSLAGLTPIPILAAAMSSFDLAVTLDTGAMHIAWAVGLPSVVVAPAWQLPIEWLPLGRPHMTVLRRNEIWCRHCGEQSCATRECMEETKVSEVVRAAEYQLRRHPPAEHSRQARRARVLNSDHRGSGVLPMSPKSAA